MQEIETIWQLLSEVDRGNMAKTAFQIRTLLTRIEAKIPKWLPIEEYNAEEHGKNLFLIMSNSTNNERVICVEFDSRLKTADMYLATDLTTLYFMPLPQPPEKE